MSDKLTKLLNEFSTAKQADPGRKDPRYETEATRHNIRPFDYSDNRV